MISLNLITCWNWWLLANKNYQQRIDQIMALGYDNVMALPLRGMTGDETGIGSFEPPWNKNVGHGAIRQMNKIDPVLDYIFFEQEGVEEIEAGFLKHGAKKVLHYFAEPEALTEIYQGLNLNKNEIRERCEEGGHHLVFDTRHIMESFGEMPLGKSMREWKEVLQILYPFIEMVHVQPISVPVEEFLSNPFKTDEAKLVFYLFELKGKTLDLAIEYNPGPLVTVFPSKGIDLADRFLEAAHKFL